MKLSLVYFNSLFEQRYKSLNLNLLKLKTSKIKLSDWADMIKFNFEKEFLASQDKNIYLKDYHCT